MEVLRPLVLVLQTRRLEVAFGHQVQCPGECVCVCACVCVHVCVHEGVNTLIHRYASTTYMYLHNI